MLKIVPYVVEVNTGGMQWSLIDDDTGKWLGEVDPHSLKIILQEESQAQKRVLDGDGFGSEKEQEKGTEKDIQVENFRIPLTEKRFLDIEDFQAYTSLGKIVRPILRRCLVQSTELGDGN